MKSLISKFSEDILSDKKMKNIKGGWYYTFGCTCGSSGFTGTGNLQDYRTMASYYCSGQGGLSCNFSIA